MDDLMRFPGAVRRDARVEAWFAHVDPLRALVRAWYERMRACGPDVRELLHDGCPVACVGDAAFAYVNAFTAHASVGFFNGAPLADPQGLLEGTGKRMRHVKLRLGRQVDADALGALIAAAYQDMRGRAMPNKPTSAAKQKAPDWRGETLARIRALIREADPDIVEDMKWKKPSNPAGVPVWERHGIVCTGETYKAVVKLTFANGAVLADPAGLFNASLDGNVRRAIDIHEGDKLDAKAFKALIRAAVSLNTAKQAAKKAKKS